MWIPIDQTLAAVDQAFVVHFHEDFDHRIVKIWAIFMAGARVTLRTCHGEGCAVPIAGGAQAFELVYNCPARLLFPLPDFFQKLLAAQSHAARFAPVCQLPLNDHLRGNARMVCPGLPKGVKAAHPVPAHQDILQSIVEGMTHMQNARNIGRGNHDAIARGSGFGIGPGCKTARRLPGFIKTIFSFRCVEFFHGHNRGVSFEFVSEYLFLWASESPS